jgi:hypothetical protein
MTALDPSPVLTSRRGALDQLDDLRERVARLIDRPTAEGLRLLTLGAKDFLRYEIDEVLPEVLTAGFTEDRIDALTAGHQALAARLNGLAWAAAGTVELQTEALKFRHELLAHVDLYNDLRLPRGSLIPGS